MRGEGRPRKTPANLKIYEQVDRRRLLILSYELPLRLAVYRSCMCPACRTQKIAHLLAVGLV